MMRIWADFHTRDSKGRIPLTTAGSEDDLAKYRHEVRAGARALFYDSTFEVEGLLNLEDGVWLADVDWTTYRPTSNRNLARELRGWGFPPPLGYAASHFLSRLARRTAEGLRTPRSVLAQISAETGLHALEAESLVQHLCEFDGQEVIGVAGISLREYPHRIIFRGNTLFAWCPFDAICAAVLLNEPLRVESLCPETGAVLRITIGPLSVISIEPQTIVFGQTDIWPPEHPAENYLDIQEVFCRRQFLFRDSEALVRYSRKAGHVDVITMPPAEMLDLARQAWREVERYVSGSSWMVQQ